MTSIYQYDNSREFFRAYIDQLPKKGWGEIQRWAELLGVQASYISQVLADAKIFSVDQGFKVAMYLGLKDAEVDFLMTIMEKERAASFETKKYFDEKLKTLKSEAKQLSKRLPSDRKFTEVEKSIFYSSWIYSAVRLFCSLSPKGKSLQEITDRFSIKRADASKILEFLCDSGLCIKKNNLYALGTQQTLLESTSAHIHRHRQNWRVKTLSQVETTQAEELVFSAPFSIGQKDFEALREELALFLEGFYKRVKTTEPDQLAILNIDLMKFR